MLLAKLPVPVPSSVLGSDVVGLADVLQHTPLCVIEAPPSVMVLPPESAVVEVTFVTAVVFRVGTSSVVNGTSAP